MKRPSPETYPRGDDHFSSKLTSEKVREIRALYEGGATQKELGERFGVCQSHISDVVKRVVWKHI